LAKINFQSGKLAQFRFSVNAEVKSFWHSKNCDYGRFKICPMRILLKLTPGFAACNALNLTLYLREIAAAVSPETTVCVRGLAAIVVG